MRSRAGHRTRIVTPGTILSATLVDRLSTDHGIHHAEIQLVARQTLVPFADALDQPQQGRIQVHGDAEMVGDLRMVLCRQHHGACRSARFPTPTFQVTKLPPAQPHIRLRQQDVHARFLRSHLARLAQIPVAGLGIPMLQQQLRPPQQRQHPRSRCQLDGAIVALQRFRRSVEERKGPPDKIPKDVVRGVDVDRLLETLARRMFVFADAEVDATQASPGVPVPTIAPDGGTEVGDRFVVHAQIVRFVARECVRVRVVRRRRRGTLEANERRLVLLLERECVSDDNVGGSGGGRDEREVLRECREPHFAREVEEDEGEDVHVGGDVRVELGDGGEVGFGRGVLGALGVASRQEEVVEKAVLDLEVEESRGLGGGDGGGCAADGGRFTVRLEPLRLIIQNADGLPKNRVRENSRSFVPFAQTQQPICLTDLSEQSKHVSVCGFLVCHGCKLAHAGFAKSVERIELGSGVRFLLETHSFSCRAAGSECTSASHRCVGAAGRAGTGFGHGTPWATRIASGCEATGGSSRGPLLLNAGSVGSGSSACG